MTRSEQLLSVVRDLVGQRCERAENPYGSILSIDFGRLALRADDPPTAKPHGWRHLTILSPWRMQTSEYVVSDWNVNGGVHGGLQAALLRLVGNAIVDAETTGPAWDLVLKWDNGVSLFVFSDMTDDRDSAWFILGTDGIEASAAPEIGEQPHRGIV